MKITHYVNVDEPGWTTGGLARALCGRLVSPQREHAPMPSCERCARLLKDREAMDPGGPNVEQEAHR